MTDLTSKMLKDTMISKWITDSIELGAVVLPCLAKNL